MVPHQCWLEGQDHVPQLAGNAFPDAAQTLLATFATRAHCCLIFSLSTKPSLSFSTQLLSTWIAPACIYLCMRLFLSRCRALNFPRLFLGGSSLLISPASWDPSGWPLTQLGPLLQAFYDLKTCWVYTCFQHTGHWWRGKSVSFTENSLMPVSATATGNISLWLTSHGTGECCISRMFYSYFWGDCY